MSDRETTELRWFDAYGQCRRCRKVAHGILRGSSNESYGPHCRKCAQTRLKNSEKARKALEADGNVQRKGKAA